MSETSILTPSMRIANAVSFINNIGDEVGENTLYIGIGRTEPWNEFENDPLFEPPIPEMTREYITEVWDQLVGVQKIESFDTKLVIPRRDWGDPVLDDTLSYNVGDVVAVNTLPENSHPSHAPGIQVYQCVETPETGVCDVDPGSNTNELDCNTNGGEWVNTPSPGNVDNIPRGSDSGFDTGDGYKWDFLYQIPRDAETSYASDEWLVVPSQSEVDNESERWGLTNEVTFGDNRIAHKVGAFYIQILARIAGSEFVELAQTGTQYRQLSLISNALVVNSSTTNTIQKAVNISYRKSELMVDSGDILFIENRTPVSRDLDQIEEVRIITRF